MQVDPTKSNSYDPSAPDNTLARIPQKALGQNDFLKLITVQLANQDPMKPMEDTSFIAQMAQFTSLQQTTDLVTQIGMMRSSADLASASALLGQTVTVQGNNDTLVTGKVDAVDTTATEPRLVIGGQAYSLAGLKRVEPTPQPATPTS